MKKTIFSILLLGLVQLGWTQCSDPSGFYLEPLDPVFCTGQDNQLNIMPSNWNTPAVPPFFSYWSASWEYSTDGVNWTTDPLAAGSPFLVPSSLPGPYYYRPLLECSDDGSTYTLPFYLVEPIINAYIIGNTDLCPNGLTELTLNIPYHDIDTLNVTSVHWNLDGDPSGLPDTTTVTATQEGTYYVNLIIENSIGNCYVSSPQFELASCPTQCQGTPAGGNTVPNLSTVCSGATFQLSLSGASQIATQTYQWQSAPDGFVWTDIIGETNATLSTSTTVNTYYRCGVTCGPTTDYSTYAFVSVFETVSGSGPNCPDGTSMTVSPTDAESYQWFLDGQLIVGADSASLPANAAGSYTVAITKGNCTLTTEPVVVNPLPYPNVLPHSVQICDGDSVQLSAVAGMTVYQWFFIPEGQSNIQNISSATGQTYMAHNAGTYFVTVTNQFGCTNSADLITFAEGAVVTINSNPVPSIVSSNGTLSVSGSFATYQWYFNGGLISGANGPTYTPTEDGTYTVEVTDDNGCHGTSEPFEVNIPPAYPKFVINEFNYYHPNGNKYDYIELKNVDTVAWDMAEFRIQLIESVNGVVNVYSELADPILYGMLQPNDYFVIGALGGVPNQDVSPFSETLDNIKGDTGAIVLFFGNDQIDRVSYGVAVPSYSEGPPIAIADSSAKAFVRIPDGIDTDDNGFDFKFTCGTSGESNTVSSACQPQFVINEIVADSVSYSFTANAETVYEIALLRGLEILNKSDEMISILGFKLQIITSDSVYSFIIQEGPHVESGLGNSWQEMIQQGLFDLLPGEYFQIGERKALTPEIPDDPNQGDIHFLNFPSSLPVTYKLFDANGSLMDMVGIGFGALAEGDPIIGIDTNAYLNFSRIPDGEDSGNNSADFRFVCETDYAPFVNLDFDGCDHTGILEQENTLQSSVYPNPCSDLLHVNWNGSAKATYTVNDVQGRQIMSGQLSNRSTIQTKDLPTGLYVLRLVDEDGHTGVQRFVKR